MLPVLTSIEFWSEQLSRYPLHSLRSKPIANAWSLGQLYIHLIDDTAFYSTEAESCLRSPDNAAKDCTPEAHSMFLNNSFPDENITGSPDHAHIAQPENVQAIIAALHQLKNRALSINRMMIANNSYSGKTQHPGLGYFSAEQWMQFADMHFRHHLKQLKRLDLYLATP